MLNTVAIAKTHSLTLDSCWRNIAQPNIRIASRGENKNAQDLIAAHQYMFWVPTHTNQDKVAFIDSLLIANLVAPNPTQAPATNLPLSDNCLYLEQIDSSTGCLIGSMVSFSEPHRPCRCFA